MPAVVPPPKRVNERPSHARSKTGLKASIALCTSAVQPPDRMTILSSGRKMRLSLTPGRQLSQCVGRLAVFRGRGQAEQNGALAPVEARQLFTNALHPLEGVAGAQQRAAGGGRPPRRSKILRGGRWVAGRLAKANQLPNGFEGFVRLLDQKMEQGAAGPGPGKIYAGFDLLAAAVDRVADHRRRQACNGIVGHMGDFEFEVAQQRHRRGGVYGNRLMKQTRGLWSRRRVPSFPPAHTTFPRLFADGRRPLQEIGGLRDTPGCADDPNAFRPG